MSTIDRNESIRCAVSLIRLRAKAMGKNIPNKQWLKQMAEKLVDDHYRETGEFPFQPVTDENKIKELNQALFNKIAKGDTKDIMLDPDALKVMGETDGE